MRTSESLKVSVGIKDTYLCTVLDLVIDSVGMVNAPFEEGEGGSLLFLLIFFFNFC